MRFGLETCGSNRRVVIQIKYLGRTLDWKRYVRPPQDFSAVNDFLKSIDAVGEDESIE